MAGRGEEEYPPEELHDLEELCLDRVAAYLRTRPTTRQYAREEAG
jgi:hypothetical protein